MQDAPGFEPEPHADFIFIVEETWPGAFLVLGTLVAGVGLLLWVLRRRRGRGRG